LTEPSAEAPAKEATPYAWYVLWVLFAVNTVNFVDRQILAILQEGIREDLSLSDTQLGFLQMGFSTFYVLAGFPIARLADRGNRRTIIAVGIALFGAITSLSGAAQSFVQLALARIGVGVGEAAVGPAAGSILSDYFPLSRRSSAFAVNAAAIHIGIFLGFAIGGWIAQDYGWRWAFLIAGIPGVALALIVAFTVREPERGAMDPMQAAASAPPIKEILALLWKRRSLRHLAAANMASVMAGASIFAWGPSFLIRHHGLEKAEVGLWMGLLTGGGGLIGTLAAGWLTDKLQVRSARFFFWVPAAAAILSIPPAVGFLLWPDGRDALLFIGPFVLFTGMYLGPAAAITQTLVPQRMRGLGIAILHTFTTLVGTGLGPLVVGFASDLLEPRFGTKSISVALLGLSIVVYSWSACHYLVGARYVEEDLENAGHDRDVSGDPANRRRK
jgi:predicted MFS family arabinose efflux permease